MYYTFGNCRKIVSAPTIPNSVLNMCGTFMACFNLTSAPEIPNSVIDMSEAFMACSNITSSSNIPANVKTLSETFSGCSKLTGNIIITSNQIISAMNCFSDTSLTKNVYIPMHRTEESQKNLYCWDGEDWETGDIYQFYTTEDYAQTLPEEEYNIVIYYANGSSNPNVFGECRSFDQYVDFMVTKTDWSMQYWCQRNTNGDTSITLPIGSPTDTYQSFMDAGYDTTGTNCGVYLKDINQL